jgi:hypothetical protein
MLVLQPEALALMVADVVRIRHHSAMQWQINCIRAGY